MDLNYKLLDKQIMPQNRISLLAIIIAFILALLPQLKPILFINTSNTWWLYAFFIIFVIFFHEGLHGLAAFSAGATPSVVYVLGFSYTTVKERINREAYLITAITPLIIISLISFLLLCFWEAGRGYIYFAFIINLAGCVGDLWIVFTLLPYPKGAIIQDTNVGYDIYVLNNN